MKALDTSEKGIEAVLKRTPEISAAIKNVEIAAAEFQSHYNKAIRAAVVLGFRLFYLQDISAKAEGFRHCGYFSHFVKSIRGISERAAWNYYRAAMKAWEKSATLCNLDAVQINARLGDAEFVETVIGELQAAGVLRLTDLTKERESKQWEKPRIATPVELEEQAINQEVADFLLFGENFCSFVATEKMEALRRTNSPDLERIRDGAAGVCARIDEILSERENERAKNGQY